MTYKSLPDYSEGRQNFATIPKILTMIVINVMNQQGDL